MKHHLSRKHFLSLGITSGLGWIAASCVLEDVQPTPKEASGGAGGTGVTSSGTTTGGTAGTGGSSTVGSGTTTTGSGGSGGSGTAGSGGSGTAGKGGSGGSGGSGSGGAAGKGGSGGSAGGGGSGGSGGSKDAGAGGSGQDGGGMCNGMITANISQNHNAAGNGPHGLVIPMADIMTGAAKTYVTTNVTGMIAQNHMHYVQVTAADFTALKAGMTVKKHSCSGGDHEYVLKCGGTTDMGAAPVGCADECGGMMTNPCM